MDYIEEFLENYAGILRDDHQELILGYLPFLRKHWNATKTSSKFGNHFTICPWSVNSTTCGPDSCPCYYVHIYSKRIDEIVTWYEKFVKK